MGVEKMSEEAMQEVLDSLAKIGKQWGLGESVGRVWGFLLFKSCPVTQREIQEGMGYSRGLISRCLRQLKLGPMIKVSREGREIHYSVNTSLTEGFGDVVKRFLADNIKPMIKLLSENSDKITVEKVREDVLALLDEYKKLNITVLLFSNIIDHINVMNLDVEEMEGMAKRISMKLDGDIKTVMRNE